MRATVVFLAAATLGACGGSDPDTSADAATDADTDTDSDTDSDSDGDACENPEVQQDGTSLVWLRCLAGQCLVGDACQWGSDPDAGNAEAERYTWDEAAAVCPDPYRLPTVEEIAALLGGCGDIAVDENSPAACDPCEDGATCDEIFPEAAGYENIAWESVHWTSTQMNETNAWRANFKTGVVEPAPMSNSATIVCVREE